MSRPRHKARSVFTTFGKAIAAHIALSFSLSADKGNCDPSCRVWESCYASRIERIYRGLTDKLKRHQRWGPVRLVSRALAELATITRPIRWARLSVDGSLPSRQSMDTRQWKAFVAVLRRFVSEVLARGAKWHIPVESLGKARSYRKALEGLGVVVRRTSQARSVRELLQSTDPRAWIVAREIHAGCVTKEEIRANTELAKLAADQIRQAGQTAVICPAITRDSKCGKCTACADHRVNVVLYPFHG